MQKKYTYFEQHQSGIYNVDCAAEGRIGTEHVGPCVAFFLYDILHKSALVIHLDQGSSILTVNREIKEFMGDNYKPDNYHAFLVGGWRASLEIEVPDNTANEIVKLLNQLGVKKIENRLYQLDGVPGVQDPKHFYEMICLDLNTGKLAIAKKKGHDFLRVDDYSIEDKKLRVDCLQYAFKRGMLPGLKATLDYFEKLMAGEEHSITDDVNSFYQTIIKDNDGAPFIPSIGLREKSDAQLLALALSANNSDIIVFLRLLYTNFINPVSALLGKEGNTPLHYATAKLNREPNNYALRAIVLLMVLRGERDLNNEKGKSALSYMKSDELRNLKSVCEEILEVYPKLFMNINVQGQVIIMTQIAIKELVNQAFLIAKDHSKSSAYDNMEQTVQNVVSRARRLLNQGGLNPVRRFVYG